MKITINWLKEHLDTKLNGIINDESNNLKYTIYK